MGKYKLCCKKCIVCIIHIFSIQCCKKKKRNTGNMKIPNIPDKKDSVSLDIIESDIEDNIEELGGDIKEKETNTEQYKGAIEEYRENVIEEEYRENVIEEEYRENVIEEEYRENVIEEEYRENVIEEEWVMA